MNTTLSDDESYCNSEGSEEYFTSHVVFIVKTGDIDETEVDCV